MWFWRLNYRKGNRISMKTIWTILQVNTVLFLFQCKKLEGPLTLNSTSLKQPYLHLEKLFFLLSYGLEYLFFSF